MANHRVANVRDELKEGEMVEVKVINIDPSGKVRLSRKVLLKEGEGTSPKYPGAGAAHAGRGGRAHIARSDPVRVIAPGARGNTASKTQRRAPRQEAPDA
jgi:hypothetical protein